MKLFKIIFFIFIFSLAQQKIYSEIEIDARYVILQDHHSGKILYEKDADTRIYPASLTKIMTSIVAFDLLKKGETSSGKNRRSITIEAKKWVKLSEYESASGKGKKIMDQLENDFSTKASELCSSTGNFNILEKRMETLEIDETPAFGIEPKIKIGVNGVVECI